MYNSIKASFCVSGSQDGGFPFLPEEIACQAMVQANFYGAMVFSTAKVVRGQGASAFGVAHNVTTEFLVIEVLVRFQA